MRTTIGLSAILVLQALLPIARAQTVLGQIFGVEVACAGDIDKDGVPDLLVGDPNDPVDSHEKDWPGGRPLDEGRVWVLSGKEGRILFTLKGDAAGDRFGMTALGPGDLDGDGTPDFIIGAPCNECRGEEPTQRARNGYVRAFSGKDARTLYAISVPGDCMKDGWYSSGRGPTLCGLGDIDSDGHPDFAVGSPFEFDTKGLRGSVRIVSGKEGGVLRTILGANPSDRFGYSLACAGDLDGDGRADLVIGGSNGVAALVSSSTGKELRRLGSDERTESFGFTVAGIGDVDKDGRPDVAVAQPFESRSKAALFVYSGKDGSRLFSCDRQGDESGIPFGAQVVGLGDTNADGVPDFAVSCPLSFHAGDGPAVWILSGRDGSTLHELTDNLGSHFGVSLCNVGDFDGDGIADLAIGSASMRGRGAFPGFVSLYSSKTGKQLRKWTYMDAVSRSAEPKSTK